MSEIKKVTKLIKADAAVEVEGGLSSARVATDIRNERLRKYGSATGTLPKDEKEAVLKLIAEEIRSRLDCWKRQTYEIGRALHEAKKMLPHGEYGNWVSSNFGFSDKTASNFRNVYEACIGRPELVEYFPATALYQISNPKFPEELRETIFKGVEKSFTPDKGELIQLAMKYSKGEITRDGPEIQAFLKKARFTSLNERCKIEIGGLVNILKDRRGRLQEIVDAPPDMEPLALEEDAKEQELLEHGKTVIELIIRRMDKLIDEAETKSMPFTVNM